MSLEGHHPPRGALPALFCLAVGFNAFLMFCVQPMVGKWILPYLGGTPAVWNTCLFFFQTLLLAGYYYAHLASHPRVATRSPLFHPVLALAVFVLAGLSLPAATSCIDSTANPIPWLLSMLTGMVGAPFLVLAATAPLLQSWFSRAGASRSGDPYFLYVASNVGSLGGLLAYPFLIEPSLKLAEQASWWRAGFAANLLLLAACALATLTGRRPVDDLSASANPRACRRVGFGAQARWVLLAFAPSSLMMGVTTHLTMDAASAPLFWIVPLAIYLLSFVLGFSAMADRSWVSLLHERGLTLSLASVVFLMLTRATEPTWLLFAAHLLFQWFASVRIHKALHVLRPPAEHLTRFYLCLSVGGLLGGILNSLIAPMFFKSLVEYPLVAALCLPVLMGKLDWNRRGWRAGGMALAGMGLGVWLLGSQHSGAAARASLVVGGLVLAAYFLRAQKLACAAAFAVLLAGAGFGVGGKGVVLDSGRNFFGILKVVQSDDGRFHQLFHGTTLHGAQFAERERWCEPLAYYHQRGPLGRVFDLPAKPNRRVAVVGLGAGAMACHEKPGEDWTYFEIDPAVVRAASDGRHFHYLGNCGRAERRIVVGDARLRLMETPNGSLDFLILDAFSSDAIPTHLLTLEAFALYRAKLAAGGFIAAHISSRHFDLRRVMRTQSAAMGWKAYFTTRGEPNAETLREGGSESDWVTLMPSGHPLEAELRPGEWQSSTGGGLPRPWTDDYSNLLEVLIWK